MSKLSYIIHEKGGDWHPYIGPFDTEEAAIAHVMYLGAHPVPTPVDEDPERKGVWVYEDDDRRYTYTVERMSQPVVTTPHLDLSSLTGEPR